MFKALKNYFITFFKFFLCSLPPPDLPTSQDCHELTSKRRRRELREQQQQQAAALQNLPPKVSLPTIKLSSIDLGPP